MSAKKSERQRKDSKVFENPLTKGMEKVGSGWIHNFLHKGDVDPESTETDETGDRDDEFVYELCDTTI